MSSAAAGSEDVHGPASVKLRIAWVMLPLLATTYQILATSVALRLPPSTGHESWFAALLIQPLFWVLLTAELGCFFCWMRILSCTSLAAAFPLTAISYVLVMASSWLLFGDSIGPIRIVGSAAILAGASLIARRPAGA